MKTRSVVLAALFFACAAASAPAEVGRAFHISQLKCKAASCSVGEGYQPGLSTVEVRGNLPSYAGYSVRLFVFRRTGSSLHTVSQTTLGIFSDGGFTASIPAYNYTDGVFVFALMPKNADTVLAGGMFTKGTPAAPQQQRAATGSASGDWIGIAGTFGRVRIFPNGTYYFNELRGSYQQSGDQIVFSGPLAVWNNGRATMHNGLIEFYWTTAQGAKQYFVFEKQ
jgi:hypothetical protein